MFVKNFGVHFFVGFGVLDEPFLNEKSKTYRKDNPAVIRKGFFSLYVVLKFINLWYFNVERRKVLWI